MKRKIQTVVFLCNIFILALLSPLHAEEQPRKIAVRTLKCQSVKMSDDTQIPVSVLYKFTTSNFESNHPEDRNGWETQKSDENGRFEIVCSDTPVAILAQSVEDAPDQLAKIVLFDTKGDNDVTIVLEPYGKIEGKVVEQTTREPVQGQTVKLCVPVEGHEGRYYNVGLAQQDATTDADGAFRFEKVPCGRPHWFGVDKGSRDGTRKSYSYNGDKITSKPSETVQLKDYQVDSRPNYHEEYLWVFHNAANRLKFRDPDIDPIEKRFEILLERCREEGKKLLAISAKVENDAPDQKFISDLCKMLHADEEVFQWTDHFFLMALPTDEKVDEPEFNDPLRTNCQVFMKKHGIKEAALDTVTFCFFDAEGKLLGVESSWGVKEPKFSESEKLEFNLNKAVLVDMLKKYVQKQSDGC